MQKSLSIKKYFTISMLDHIITYYDNNIDDNELEHCENMLSKDKHYQN